MMLARPKNVMPNKIITPELHCLQGNVIFDTFHITPFTSVGKTKKRWICEVNVLFVQEEEEKEEEEEEKEQTSQFHFPFFSDEQSIFFFFAGMQR